jgi:hypothetical protein
VSAPRELVFDGEELTLDGSARGRRFSADPRCFDGEPVKSAFAHVCALTDPDAALPFDQPEVQQARRDALATWIPMLGDSLVCLTTLSLDSTRFGGAVTVCEHERSFADDPFARLFPGTVVRTGLFSRVQPPAGPVIERYAGAPWPAGSFDAG